MVHAKLKLKFADLLWAIGLTVASNAGAAADDRIALDVSLCHPAPQKILEHLEISWQHMVPFSHICPLLDKNSKIVFFVLTFRNDIWGWDANVVAESLKNKWGSPESALIMDKDYHIIGHLPGQFPYDPPVHMEVTFTDWHDGFPFKIEFYYPDYRTTGGKHGVPSRWNVKLNVYENHKP